jgi:2-polyprenyl-6-methoxyphenol hydroxylase-like FAD-dependent oxidoreductase
MPGEAQCVDVGIVGSGIAGSALAAALAGSGLSVALLDRRQGGLDSARGDHIQPAVQPILERWGVLNTLVLSGAEQRHGTRWFDTEGRLLIKIPVPERADCAPAFLYLNHEQIGDVLLTHAVEQGAIDISGISDWSLDRVRGGWQIHWAGAGESGTLRCTLLVGADGTASPVRSKLGVRIDRHRYQYPIAVLYGRLMDTPEMRTLDVHLLHERMVSMIPRTGGGTKIGFPIASDELSMWRNQPESVLHNQLQQWCPNLEFEHLAFGAVYPPVSQQAESYRGDGAAVLIGDARHAMHPARSMGMNTCFRVADRLASLLKGLRAGFAEAELLPLLQTFEQQFDKEVTQRLAENHAAGLQMDTLSGNGFPKLVEQLRSAAENSAISTAMALKAAGLEG